MSLITAQPRTYEKIIGTSSHDATGISGWTSMMRVYLPYDGMSSGEGLIIEGFTLGFGTNTERVATIPYSDLEPGTYLITTKFRNSDEYMFYESLTTISTFNFNKDIANNKYFINNVNFIKPQNTKKNPIEIYCSNSGYSIEIYDYSVNSNAGESHIYGGNIGRVSIQKIITAPAMQFNINGQIKYYDKGYCSINTQLKEIDKLCTKINGQLKEV